MSMNASRRAGHSYLFLVRVWAKRATAPAEKGDAIEWHGKVQHVISGETHLFQDWSELADLLVVMAADEAGRLYDPTMGP